MPTMPVPSLEVERVGGRAEFERSWAGPGPGVTFPLAHPVPSSSGLGRRPFKPETPVRIRSGLPIVTRGQGLDTVTFSPVESMKVTDAIRL
jgi:hypothetical protein